MIASFTGTQRGMTRLQKIVVKNLLRSLCIETLHHGDCVGADAEVDKMCKELGIKVILHPPIDKKKRAFCKGAFLVRKPKSYLKRNHENVNEGDVLIATPKEKTEIVRSGTWATIRYAKKLKRRTYIIRTDGSIANISFFEQGKDK